MSKAMTLEASEAPAIGRFDNSYARLPAGFHVAAEPARAARPCLVKFNRRLAEELGLDVGDIDDATLAEIFSGNTIPEGAEPVALAYAGHQFGHFVPQLGDGRAILLGEVVGEKGRRDIQLKGAGPTHFSRRGDGLAAIGPVLREYLVSEAMAALGVPTTRSLAAVTTGNSVYRETRLPGAVVTRVAASHIRVGTFQFFAARSDVDSIRRLADYVIERHFPETATAANRYLALYQAVVARQAALIARWMQLGFIHGVMNTDNMAISGETIDYGPCAFMDEYHPAKVFSSIDQHGRYAFSNQPHIAQWNLARLAECLLPLLHDDPEQAVPVAQTALGAFMPQFEEKLVEGFRAKLGLTSARDEDKALVKGLLETMAAGGADFTLTFRTLAEDVALAPEEAVLSTGRLFADPAGFDAWARLWLERLALEDVSAGARAALMKRANPKFIPRNHLVEEVIAAAIERDDFGPFHEMLAVVTHPYDEQPGRERYAEPPRPDERVLQTFCGT
ncbi:MAG: YdiU family protein [Mesorhizobium sp.]|nr:YdiU family protein [Mesorhizobium sp.]MCO5160796.1 YdiU family protein [Mesorhizobium sp.]